MTTGRNQNVPRTVAAFPHAYLMGALNLGVTADDLDPAFLQQAVVDPLKIFDLIVFRLDQSIPIQTGALNCPAVAAGVFEVASVGAPVHEQLLRDAPSDDTGSAEAAFLDQGNLRAVASRASARRNAATAAADGEEVEVELGHGRKLTARPAPHYAPSL